MERQQDREHSPVWRNLTKLFPAALVVAAVGMAGSRANAEGAERTAQIQEENEDLMAAGELEEMLAVLYAPEEESKETKTEAAANKKAADTKSSAIKTSATASPVAQSAASTTASSGQGSTVTPTTTVPAAGYQDGTYQGSAAGFGGTITVQVTVSGGKITAIDILSAAGETPSYLESAKSVIAKIISGQTPNVDAVSGATYSSNGIIQAVQNALAKAGKEENSTQQATPTPAPKPTETSKPTETPKPEEETEEMFYKDGSYTAKAQGFQGLVTVTVTIKEGNITELTYEHEDTPAYFKKAWKVLYPAILEKQSAKGIDTVSGATYSSEGILNAADKAIEKSITKVSVTPTATPTPTVTPTPTMPPTPTVTPTITPTPQDGYRDGTYTGSGDGFNGITTVVITVENGKIISAVYETEDDEEEFYMAWSSIYAQILGNQSADEIDTVSGATFSSEGLIEAFQNALNQAKGETQ